MPAPQSPIYATTTCVSPLPRNRMRCGLIGLFILACLVLPGLIWIPPTQNPPPRVRATDAWQEFFDPQFETVTFESAAPLDLHLGLLRSWPDAAEMDTLEEPLAQWALSRQPYELERRPVLESQLATTSGFIDKGQLNYKVTPSFNFENRELQLSGVVIRLWINF